MGLGNWIKAQLAGRYVAHKIHKIESEVSRMKGAKSLLKSVTFWGIVIASAGPLAARYGYDLSGLKAEEVIVLVEGALRWGGSVMGVIGRIRVKQPIAVPPAVRSLIGG